MRWAGLLFGVLAVAVAGCGTMSGGAETRSALLASPALPPLAPSPAESAAGPRVEPLATAVAAEPRGDTGTAVTPSAESLATPPSAPPFVPVAFEPMSAEQSRFYLVASVGPLTPGSLVAQSSSPRSSSPPADVEPQEYDPWEPFNEKIFTFNYNFDRYLLKPVAKGYNFVMPDEVQRMIANGFDNVNPVPKWVNNLLQANFKGFMTEFGRFLINSTLGIGGLFDIAKQEFGLQKTKVDFGQTLGKWGVQPGPYLILPFLPPLTVRDGIGYGVDGAMDPLSYFIPFIWDKLGMKVGETVNDRSLNLDLFQGFEETTVDLYSAVRNGYLQRRYNLIKGDR
jgi:phospholipid-binding lipoprotein MlaA